MDTIKLTVGIPMFNSKHIAWLPLESLCNQKNVDFDWEVVIIEEQNNMMFGEENVRNYTDRLKDVGCKKIIYKPIFNWIPLARKWRDLGWMASSTSQYFLIQDSDDYSQPFRLKETHDRFISSDADWLASLKGIFYVIKTGEIIIWDKREVYSGLSKATKTDYVRRLSISDKEKDINGWMMRTISDMKKDIFIFGTIEENTWDSGFFTHGLNNISLTRYQTLKEKHPGRLTLDELKEKIPHYVLDRLSKYEEISKI